IPGDLPRVEGDRDKLQQVFTNLVSNSLKFANSGSTVCVDAQPKGDGTVEVSVADEGPGIAEEELESIFDKFRQVGDTLTEKPEGSGLGLAICREIVGLHGGHIWARSMLSRGSTFYFTVPAVGQAPAAEVEVPPEPPAVEEDDDETLPMAIVIEVPDIPGAPVEDPVPTVAPEPVPTVAPAPAPVAPAAPAAPAPASPAPSTAAAREEDTPSFEDAVVAGSLPPLRLRKPKKPEGGRGLPPMQS
ncbi:MAG: sensor histidine kinase, partial [Planctomycetota bacterium]